MSLVLYITLSQFELSHLIGMFGHELIYVNGEVDDIMINHVFLDTPYFWTNSDKAMSQGFDRLDPVKKRNHIPPGKLT